VDYQFDKPEDGFPRCLDAKWLPLIEKGGRVELFLSNYCAILPFDTVTGDIFPDSKNMLC
jgi:hypothetical protein